MPRPSKTVTASKPRSQPKTASALHAQRVRQAEVVVERLSADHPNPRCELYYRTPLQLLISVVLSAKMTDKGVNRCMQPLYDEGFGLPELLALGEAGFLGKIRSIGLAPTKAKRVLELAALLRDRHGGEVPRTRDELEALPGVGRKTANVILGELYGEPTLAVDTHVYRVTQRLGLHDETTPEKAEKVLLSVVDARHLPRAHHLFILHGRYLCKAQRPECERCPLADICPSRRSSPTSKKTPRPAKA